MNNKQNILHKMSLKIQHFKIIKLITLNNKKLSFFKTRFRIF